MCTEIRFRPSLQAFKMPDSTIIYVTLQCEFNVDEFKTLISRLDEGTRALYLEAYVDTGDTHCMGAYHNKNVGPVYVCIVSSYKEEIAEAMAEAEIAVSDHLRARNKLMADTTPAVHLLPYLDNVPLRALR